MTPEDTVLYLKRQELWLAGWKEEELPDEVVLQMAHNYYESKERQARADREFDEMLERMQWEAIKRTSPEMADPR